jgi:hypothetical protein
MNVFIFAIDCEFSTKTLDFIIKEAESVGIDKDDLVNS